MTKGSRFAVQALIQIVTLAGFWIACVSDLQRDDLLLGVGAVALSVAFCLFTIRTLPLQFRPTLRDIVQVWRLPWYIVSGLYEIAQLLLLDLFGRRAGSHFRSTPWHPTENNGPDTAKRTLAIGYTTIAPNFIIVGIDCGRGQMLFHQIEKSSVPIMTQQLGAENPE